MYGIITLYIGLIIAFIVSLRLKVKDRLFYQTMVVIVFKVLFLTILYLIFFSDKDTINTIKTNTGHKVIYNEYRK